MPKGKYSRPYNKEEREASRKGDQFGRISSKVKEDYRKSHLSGRSPGSTTYDELKVKPLKQGKFKN